MKTRSGDRRRPALGWHAGIALAAALAALNLIGGIGGALVRIGAVDAGSGPVGAAATAWHGGVMVCGFFGTLIALERAVALKRGLWVPVLAGACGVAAWTGMPAAAVLAGWLLAAVGLVGLYAWAGLHRAWSLHLRIELAAAVFLALGTLAYTLARHDAALLGWCAFLLLTIAGERRELTQMLRLPAWAQHAYVTIVAVVPIAYVLALVGQALAAALAWWLACALLGAWLLRHDLAPRQRGAPGWAGHTGWNLSVGYAWLLVAALVGLAQGRIGGAALHLLLLGFVFAMVFGHAPIILPALGGVRPHYTPWARLPLAVMALSLLLRLAAELGGWTGLRAAAGIGHAVAIALFALTMLQAAWRGRRPRT